MQGVLGGEAHTDERRSRPGAEADEELGVRAVILFGTLSGDLCLLDNLCGPLGNFLRRQPLAAGSAGSRRIAWSKPRRIGVEIGAADDELSEPFSIQAHFEPMGLGETAN